MKWKFNFNKVEVSEALKEYTLDRFEKTANLLLKDSHWQAIFSQGKYNFQVEVIVSNPDGQFKAKCISKDSFHVAVDEVAGKLSKQFLKQKERMQDHKKFERSKRGRMQRLNKYLEYDNSPFPHKKTA